MNDFHKALNDVRAAHAENPASVHARRSTLYDLLLDSGVIATVRPYPPLGQIGSFFGVTIVFEDAMAEGVVDFRTADGRTLRRMIQSPEGQWYSVSVPDLLTIPDPS